jgi:hypothetical protein
VLCCHLGMGERAVEWHCVEWHYVEWHYVEWHYVEWHSQVDWAKQCRLAMEMPLTIAPTMPTKP